MTAINDTEPQFQHPHDCKHLNLIVQRNNGFRWVTCMDCLTDFEPVDSGRSSDV